jgi:hypothetical protein
MKLLSFRWLMHSSVEGVVMHVRQLTGEIAAWSRRFASFETRSFATLRTAPQDEANRFCRIKPSSS